MAGDFDSAWDAAAARLHTAVDARLGDRIKLSIAGGPYAFVQGFVIDENEADGLGPIDDILGNRKRLKIAKSILPFPGRTTRIQHPKIGPGTYCAGGEQPQTEGLYWLFDLQERGA